MAQQISVQYTDDLTGEPIASGKGGPVRFGFDGIDYELDLTDANRKKFAKALDEYIAYARRVGRRTHRAGARTQVAADPAVIRAWAQSNGIDVSPRGRVSNSVREQYEATGRR